MKNLFIIPIFLFAQFLFSQDQLISIGSKHIIKSEALEQERPYWIYLPKDYSEDGDPVAILYLLDGDGHFHHTSGILDFLKNQGVIPSMMIVAIPNTDDRTRDLTPKMSKNAKTKDNFPTSGGADQMLAFIENELMPYIQGTYNVNQYEILVGHSFGGLFSMHALIHRPHLFDAHISISPSLWWDDQALVEKVDSLLVNTDSLDCYYFMTMGNEGGTMLGGAMKVAALMEEKSPEKFNWKFVPMEKETHGSIPHRSTYDGLEAIFSSWYRSDLAKIFMETGWHGINKHYNRISEKLGIVKELTESEINQLGYNLLGLDAIDKALEVFKENSDRFPDSYNAYDSYAEALMVKGHNDQAVEFYKKSIKLFPGNTNAVDMLKKLGVEYDVSEMFISLPVAKLEQYLGKYKLDMGITIEIILDNEELFVTSDQIPREKLMPFGDHKFCLEHSRFYLEFKESAGEITGFDAQLNGGQRGIGVKL